MLLSSGCELLGGRNLVSLCLQLEGLYIRALLYHERAISESETANEESSLKKKDVTDLEVVGATEPPNIFESLRHIACYVPVLKASA